MYQLLFCDDPQLFRPQPNARPAPWQTILLAAQPDRTAIANLAEDQSQDSRCRVLAYNWLRQNGQKVPAGELFGVVVEVPLQGGLETLAAYTDGSVRYMHQSGKFSIFEAAPPQVKAQAEKLLVAGRAAVAQIGPWNKARLAAPKLGKARMTFLVSDGLYFGEGPLPGIDRDQIGGPVFHEAGKLLTIVVDAAVQKG